MRVLVTGATGLVGSHLVTKLLAKGHEVRAMVRNAEKAAGALPPAAEVVVGDITAPATLARAVSGVDWVFHAAGLPEQWVPDEGAFDRANRLGTANVLRAALSAQAKRVVYTSTMDVFRANREGVIVDDRIDPSPKPTAYERSKQAAETEAQRLIAEGLDVVFVNPAAIYGPSPAPSVTNSFILRLLQGKVPLLPPGDMSLVYVEGLAEVHVAAAERGTTGAHYLVADGHVTPRQFAEEVLQHTKARRVPPVAPSWLLRLIAVASAPFARALKREPLIAPGQLTWLLWNARVDASKTETQLGFTPTPLSEGVRRTVAYFLERKML